MKKVIIFILTFSVILTVVLLLGWRYPEAENVQDAEQKREQQQELQQNQTKNKKQIHKDTETAAMVIPAELSTEVTRESLAVTELTVRYGGREQMEISFTPLEADVETYYLMRKEMCEDKESQWTVCQEIPGEIKEELFCLTDAADGDGYVQYKYRVDVKPADEDMYEGIPGTEVLASNVLICIDPGHFVGKNQAVGDDSFGYAEGDFTLRIGLALRDILKEKYGIDSVMTRDTPSIILAGYTDGVLDGGHISMRGAYAGEMGCDLFLSLHTNANQDNVNGHPTWQQPIGITKTIILANQLACGNEDMIRVGNGIGTNVSVINFELGISGNKGFDLGIVNEVREWSDAYNDSLDTAGSIRCRLGSNGDYYGVLKGAANAGVPGMIVEHGMHTVPEFRKQAMESDLYKQLAEADAYGIAYGFGFVSEIQMRGE